MRFKIMDSVVNNVIRLLDHKCVVCDDMLVLAFEYCKMISMYYSDSNKSDLLKKFLLSLEMCTKSCLDGAYQSKDTKEFDYKWFKCYLLHSSIWFCKFSNGKSLHNEIAIKSVDSALIKQKKFIWNHCKEEEKNDSISWNKLINFENSTFVNDHGNRFIELDTRVR